MQGVWSLGWEDPLEKGMATHSSILVCLFCICKFIGLLKDIILGVGKERVGQMERVAWKHIHDHS